MAIAFDTRTSTFGNMHVVTGTYGAGDTSLALGNHLAEIKSITLTATAGASAAPWVSGISGTTATIDASGSAGKFLAIGFRS